MTATEPDHLHRHRVAVRIGITGEQVDIRHRLMQRHEVVDGALNDQGRHRDLVHEIAGTTAGQHILLALIEDAQQIGSAARSGDSFLTRLVWPVRS
ncbi:hypothetical protein [Mycobacterium sp. OTB74]|uniref:hypothetical protein n=1 Tax=Mycobacterium sp. OTB74 TaxID=1853452 RepID=UPI002474E2D7|nr:hypothetical protein [Mycobacterium sp. OTB74]MDH6245913.1 hypothetical protein [Mycobacterium sp. OTB74]